MRSFWIGFKQKLIRYSIETKDCYFSPSYRQMGDHSCLVKFGDSFTTFILLRPQVAYLDCTGSVDNKPAEHWNYFRQRKWSMVREKNRVHPQSKVKRHLNTFFFKWAIVVHSFLIENLISNWCHHISFAIIEPSNIFDMTLKPWWLLKCINCAMLCTVHLISVTQHCQWNMVDE